ncbi:MAG: ABC transporter permease [Gemmatimonadetes bacterium]|nr:ABC transporter permease [Gemmatimonadota bacterium]
MLFAVQEFCTLGGRALRFTISRPFYARDVLVHMDRIGVGSLPPLLLTSTFIGMVIALQTAAQLRVIGAEALLGNLVGTSLIQEGPTLAALMVAGRVSSGIAAQLASMRTSEQIDALQTFGTDPIRKLVTPRVLAGMSMVPVLSVITALVGVLGGLIVALAKAVVPADVYLRGVIESLGRKDFFFGFFPAILLMTLVKPIFFGLIITLSGCYYGLNATGGGEGVGRATTKAMVLSFVLILISDFFLTKLLLVAFNLARYKAFRKPGDFGNVG